jgi:RNA recognition motif-containing protein
VNDIPSHFTGEDLGAVFREKGFLVVSATVVVDKQGQKAKTKTKTKTKAKNRVYGVVEFPTVEERQRAKVALNKTLVGDRRITIAIRDNKATT